MPSLDLSMHLVSSSWRTLEHHYINGGTPSVFKTYWFCMCREDVRGGPFFAILHTGLIGFTCLPACQEIDAVISF